MKKLTFALLLALACVFTAFAQTSAKTEAPLKAAENNKLEREKFDPKRVPLEDLQAAVIAARKENKRIILDVGGEWCSWCIKMDNFLAANADLKKISDENFIWLKINMSEENENKEFLKTYPEIKGYPHLFVLETDGKFLYSQDTPLLEEGKSYNLQKFTDFLKEWSPVKNPGK